MNIIQGGDMMLFIKKGSDYKSIAFATNHTITINLETKETSTKDNGGKWQTSEAGIMSWTANSENLMGNESQGYSYDELFAFMIAREPIDVRFALEGDSTDYGANKLDTVPTGGWKPATKYYEGKALITALTKNAPNGDKASFTCDLTGIGALTSNGSPGKAASTVVPSNGKP